MQSLKRKLTTPTKFGSIESPLSARTRFDAIAKRLNDLWRQDDGFYSFFSAIFQLPIHVAKAAGLENVFLIVDNVDEADLRLCPLPPFERHDELLKCALDNSNFIVACEDTNRFLHSLAPSDEDGIDLLAGMDLISTADVEDENVHGDRLVVDLDDDGLPLILHSGLCGSVIHFFHEMEDVM